MSSSPTTKSGFMISQHGTGSNNKIRFYAKMTKAGSGARNTLKSGYPNFSGIFADEDAARAMAFSAACVLPGTQGLPSFRGAAVAQALPLHETDTTACAGKPYASNTAMPAAQSTPYLPASAPRSADVVVYLDLDGVVHHEAVLWHPRIGIHMSPYEAAGHTLFEWAPLLEAALAPYPAVALVLSSTWCIRPGYGATLNRLPPSLRSRFIGGTYHKRVHGADPWTLSMFRATPRGVQVMDDVLRRKPRHWIALDDDLEGWPDAGRHHVVECHGATGLSSPKVLREFQERLHRCHERAVSAQEFVEPE